VPFHLREQTRNPPHHAPIRPIIQGVIGRRRAEMRTGRAMGPAGTPQRRGAGAAGDGCGKIEAPVGGLRWR
jgi:hypothetical protein